MSELKRVSVTKCPYCGGEELFEARAEGYCGVVLKTGVFGGAPLWAMVCRDCGSVVRFFVTDPEKALKNSQRRS